MGTGAITAYVDVAQLLLYAFWIFFAGLIYYLVRENHREGYPLDSGGRGVIEGWPPVPSPKEFLLPNGHVSLSPNPNEAPQQFSGEAVHGWSGSPIEPVGNPLTAGVGPGAWANREDHAEKDYLGNARIRPLSVMPDFGVSSKDFDPRGAELIGGDGEVAGVVTDLWVDSSDMLFRYIQLPKMNRVLLIAVLLRFMDSFMIYTEPFVVTGGGPGNSTTFLSIDLVKMAVGQFDLGPAAAMSIIYFLIILLLSWVFYTVMTNYDAER